MWGSTWKEKRKEKAAKKKDAVKKRPKKTPQYKRQKGQADRKPHIPFGHIPYYI